MFDFYMPDRQICTSSGPRFEYTPRHTPDSTRRSCLLPDFLCSPLFHRMGCVCVCVCVCLCWSSMSKKAFNHSIIYLLPLRLHHKFTQLWGLGHHRVFYLFSAVSLQPRRLQIRKWLIWLLQQFMVVIPQTEMLLRISQKLLRCRVFWTHPACSGSQLDGDFSPDIAR